MPTKHSLANLTFDQAEFVAETFAALADPTRALLVFALTRRELSVNALAELAGVSASAVSHHLSRLRRIRLVRARRAGNQVFYSVGDAHVATLFREALCHQDHVRRGLDDHARPSEELAA